MTTPIMSGPDVADWWCPAGVLRDTQWDPCTRYPAAALALFTINALAVAFAYRQTTTVGYIRLNRARRAVRDGVWQCTRFFVATIILTLAVDAVLLVLAGLTEGVWATPLAAWTGAVLIAAWLNRAVMGVEVRKLDSFSGATVTFWVLLLVAEALAVPDWVRNAMSEIPSTIAPYDKFLYSSYLLRVLHLFGLAITLVIVHPLTRDPASANEPVATAAAATADLEAGAARPAQTPPAPHQQPASENDGGVVAEGVARLRKLLPFMWPSNHPMLQVLVLLCFTTLLAGRFVMVLVPLAYKHVIDDLTIGTFPVGMIFLFAGARFLQSGFLSNLQSLLWLPVGQYTTRELSVRMFRHLHALSLRWHVHRKTGEVLRVLDRGTTSIVSLLQMLVFTLVPVLADIAVATAYFIIQFDIYFGILVIVTMGMYIFATVVITEWRTKFRRSMIELDNRTSQIGVDSLLNFETVKYYGAEEFEIQRYEKAIRDYNRADWASSGSLQVLNITQTLVISLGLLAGSLLCGYRVVLGTLTIGDFIMFYTYMLQLAGPLNWFGTMYRVIQQNFIDMEKMLKLFDAEVDVQDRPNARTLSLKGGTVTFTHVGFSYDPAHPALTDFTLTIPAGMTVALVGPSGGGKSTIFRLLFRFYDVQQGAIAIDGQDVRDVTQASLRAAIGVVPQDTVLFNDTIYYNISYARPSATEEEVYRAAQAAQIHDKVLSFPKGYQTVVGERGMRLSGGEKQRVAIARTILKNPQILLLDEYSSALDTNTERHIQAAMTAVARDRTTLIIAHRLSTIVHADMIAVVKDGQVVEQGTHDELLANESGLYSELWSKQIQSNGGAGGDEAVVPDPAPVPAAQAGGSAGAGAAAAGPSRERHGHGRFR
ncbi:Homocysteine S-methyltransferase 1 [Allomyces arbusculus]|nr:Homocysteine S-methyltransferase 1 [Allomyces arbusculus]